nr:uncharacterized protein LOC124817499 [Hydra vulgaris]
MAEISAPINGDGNYYFNTKPFLLRKWTKVTIRQYLSAGDYYYTVEIDGETAHFVKNTYPQDFQNVQLFASNIWHDPQPGFIRNLFIQCQINFCELITAISAKQNLNEINLRVNMTTDCLCSIQNISFYLQAETKLIFKGFYWDGNDHLNDFSVNQIGKFSVVQVKNLYKMTYVTFSAVLSFDKNIPIKNTSVSIIVNSRWIYSDKDPVFKTVQQRISVLKERVLIKMEPLWYYKKQNGTFLQTEKFQFICGSMQKRQPSLCFQREISTGIVTFLPINVLDVIGYDSNIAVIYGRTHGSNIIMIDLTKKKHMIITKEKCSRIIACETF